MNFYVYMLKSLGKKPVTYVGYTNNLKRRILMHNTNKGAKSTKGYSWILIYKRYFKKQSLLQLFFSIQIEWKQMLSWDKTVYMDEAFENDYDWSRTLQSKKT